MGRRQQEGGDREVGKREGEKKGHEEGGISQMDMKCLGGHMECLGGTRLQSFLLCLPVQRRVPQLVYTNKAGDCLFIFLSFSLFVYGRPHRKA